MPLEASGEWHTRILENSSDCDRELFAAPIALPDTLANGLLRAGTGLQFTCIVDFATVWADRAFGPADRFEQFAGAILVANAVCNCGELEIYLSDPLGFSPLAFCGETRHNIFESRAVGHSALWIAPTSVSAEAGALIQRVRLVAAASSPPICDGSAS